MEERRKNYEAEEERKRREILAQRKKEIQEATEKFQRSNIIRNRKKTKQIERITTPSTSRTGNDGRLQFRLEKSSQFCGSCIFRTRT